MTHPESQAERLDALVLSALMVFSQAGKRGCDLQDAMKCVVEDVLAALPPVAAVPDDMALVPKKPTATMLNALHVLPDFAGSHIIRHSIDKLPEAYAAMLAAAPKPPEV